MDCIRFKKQPNAAGFDPAPRAGNAAHYDCQLLIMTVPKGFRRIRKAEINNPDFPGNKFGGELVAVPSEYTPALLHVIYDLDPSPQGQLSKALAEEVGITEDYCNTQKGITGRGIKTPCAKSSAKSWTGDSAHALFVRYSWNDLYTGTATESNPTHDALRDIFHKDDIALAATVAPDRTVIWVPFLEGDEAGDPPGKYRVEQYRDDESYELGPVIYFDKPGIWVDPVLRFKL